MGELLLGGFIGFVIGGVLGAAFRPPLLALERFARRIWRRPALNVHIERDPSIIWAGAPDWVGFSLYFSRPFELGPAPLGRDEWLAWGRRAGGVDASVTMLSATLVANAEVSVVVENLRVRSIEKPLSDGLVLIRGVGGADLVPRQFHIDLDGMTTPVVTFLDDGGAPGKPPKFVLAPGDVERFHIWAEARQGWHEWSIDLLLLVDGRREVVTIDNEGSSFVTVGWEGLPQRMNIAGSSEWSLWPEPEEPG